MRAVGAAHRNAGDFGRAANVGFGPLFRYISGSNQAAARIPMTALPANAGVSVKNVAAHLAAARTFSGAWSEARFAKNGAALLESVRREGLTRSLPTPSLAPG